MALKVYNHMPTALSFDGLDADVPNLKGGEVVMLTFVTNQVFGGTDLASKDVDDGYVSDTSHKRPVVTKSLVSGKRPLFLADEGQAGYGTMFGTVVGGTSGQVVSGGTTLGPHSALGSGKVTCWQGPGLFGVTLDAVDQTATTGLVQTNATLLGGAALYATANGVITPNVSLAFEALVVARFLEFQTSNSKVTTPASLLGTTGGFATALIHFDVET
jgi:hypothetical protein